MSYGICVLSMVPLRTSPSEKSEMASQLLFGELAEILDRKGKQWFKIRSHDDNFVGWVAQQQLTPITPSEFELFTKTFAYNLEISQAVMADDHAFPITIGARLPNFDGMRFQIGTVNYTFSGQAIFPADIVPNTEFVLKIAKRYLYAPNLWGGRSPMGIDSAGFSQQVFKLAGFSLPREAVQQVYAGTPVDFIEQALPGDLAFFENRNGKVTHTGILMPDGQIIHAAARVQIDRLDHFGIYSETEKRYTHKLRLIKRILQDQPANDEKTNLQDGFKNKQVELFK